MTQIEVAPGFRLNVEVRGEGAPLVLLHGFTGLAQAWGEFGESLARSFRVVAVDIVGHGKSDAPEELEHYRMEQAVQDLVEVVRLAGYERAHWLGYSMGGRCALQVAAACPEAVERLVVIGGSPGIADEGERAARVASDEALARMIEREGVEAFVDYWEALPLFATQQRLPKETQARIRAGRLACGPTGLCGSLRGMGAGAQQPIHGELAACDVLALFIAGSDDTKYVAIGRELTVSMPCARFEAIPDAGHAAHIEQPAECARLVERFLKGVEEQ